MRSLEDQLAAYAAYHRDARNIVTHFIGIPLIVVSLLTRRGSKGDAAADRRSSSKNPRPQKGTHLLPTPRRAGRRWGASPSAPPPFNDVAYESAIGPPSPHRGPPS